MSNTIVKNTFENMVETSENIQMFQKNIKKKTILNYYEHLAVKIFKYFVNIHSFKYVKYLNREHCS